MFFSPMKTFSQVKRKYNYPSVCKYVEYVEEVVLGYFSFWRFSTFTGKKSYPVILQI